MENGVAVVANIIKVEKKHEVDSNDNSVEHEIGYGIMLDLLDIKDVDISN